jgi:hypothetical protein
MNHRIVPVLVLLAGLAMAFHPTLLSGFSRLQTDLGDTRLNNYLLEHGWRWLSGDPDVRLWHPTFFYPAPNALAYSDLCCRRAPLPWRALGSARCSASSCDDRVVPAISWLLLFLRRAWLTARPAGLSISFAACEPASSATSSCSRSSS